MAGIPSFESVWEEYYNEVVMNCINMELNKAVPITDGGRDALRNIFQIAFWPLIQGGKIDWVPEGGANSPHTSAGIARRFILSTAAGIGRFGARCFAHHGHIDKLGMEVTCEALVKDWEMVCPLPIMTAVAPRTSCPTNHGVRESRKLGYQELAHAGA